MVKVGFRRCRTILSPSRIGGVDYAVNPYIGCEHGCVYCYARFMSRLGHRGEEWGSFVDVKVNAPQVLRAEARRRKPGRVLLSSVTDPYQPLERRFQMTRRLLKILLDYGYPVVVQTKSTLILRDLDLLTRFEDCQVGFTIITIDEAVRRVFEPRSASTPQRIEALRELHDVGLSTYAFIGPLLPHLSERSLPQLLDALSDRVDLIIFDRLNIKCGNLQPILKALRRHYPQLVDSFLEALSPASDYYRRIKSWAMELCRERGLNYEFCY